MKSFPNFDPSLLSLDEVLSHLQTNLSQGLDAKEAAARLEEFGPNLIEEEKNHVVRDYLIGQTKDPIFLILFAAFAIKLLTKGTTDALAIAFVIVFNTFLGLFQQLKAHKTLKSLKTFMTLNARVIRNGIKQEIPSQNLVLGDVIYLESGMRIPADARLLEHNNFYCDESMLTGESAPVEKNTHHVLKQSSPAQDRLNMIFSGTTVSKGRALAVVTATGASTEFGKIAHSLYSIDESPSPLQEKLSRFSKSLSFGIIILITIMGFIGYLKSYPLNDLFLLSISLVVSAIPEGLPLAITLCLVIGIQKMAEKNALVKKLPAVETLGATTVICSDKTGTLTCNQMTVVEWAFCDKTHKVTGEGYKPQGHVEGHGDFSKVALVSALAQETTISKQPQGYVCHGDPTEASLIVFSQKLKFEPLGWSIKIVVPFESEKRFMMALAQKDNESYLLIKGSLDKVISFCSQMQTSDGKHISVDKPKLEQVQNAFSEQALRTLALAYIPYTKGQNYDQINQAVFLGIAGIQDPLRPHMTEIFQVCQDAGLKVKMITGDHPHTARAIFHKLMGQARNYTIFKGEQIDQMDQSEKDRLLPEADIFARVSPQNKLDIIHALKKRNEIVAMTGDGVNDSPSLKGADIGIAMGSGSDVSKEAASMILLDDNFMTLVKAIEMGRMIFKTLQNLITYLITTAASGVTVTCLSIFFKWSFPLLPIQFLWINLVTDGSSTLPMCFESLRPYLMKQKPLPKEAPLITKAKLIYMICITGIMASGTLGLFYFFLYHKKVPLLYAQSIAFTTLAFFQIWNVQNSRSFEEPILFSFKNGSKLLKRIPFKNNLWLLGTMTLAFFLQLLAIEWSPLQTYIRTTPIAFHDWIKIISITFSVVIFSDLFKYLRFRLFS